MMKKQWQVFWIGIMLAVGFTGLIGVLGSRLYDVVLLPDQGASWYYWKLPERQFWPMLTAWSFYTMHQVSVWILIWFSQFKERAQRGVYRNWLYGINIFFIILHIVQTHIWYDGLAQDVPVMSSQGSVIVMLVLILIMDIDRRGLFFGKKIGGFQGAKHLVKKYHGYFIAWALIYTFWYHPTVFTPGHLVGFFYMFLLFLQMSMIYTPIHMNKYWRLILEVTVMFHGALVAVYQQNNMWPMFFFGFGFIFVVTQVYGLSLPKWGIRSFQILYILGVIWIYGGFTGIKTIDQVHQITWIGIIEYGLVFVFMFVLEGGWRLKQGNKTVKS